MLGFSIASFGAKKFKGFLHWPAIEHPHPLLAT